MRIHHKVIKLMSAPEVDGENSETNISRTDAASELIFSPLERGHSGVQMYTIWSRLTFGQGC
jgi:hypothetical protein